MQQLKKPLASCVGLMVLAAIIAGCGSSSSSSSSTTASTAATTSAATTSTAPTITSASQLPASGLARAEAGVALYTQHPTQIPVTTPVGKPIPTGKTIDVLNCGIPYCNSLTTDVGLAASKLGWKTVSVLAGVTPETIHNAWVQVVNNKPSAVIASGYPQALFAQQLAQLKAEGIPVVECCISEAATNGVKLVLDPAPQGSQMAWWVVDQTHGNANVLYIDNKDYPIIDQIFTPEFMSEMKLTCPTCKVSEIDLPTTSYGTTAPSTIVSYLRSHPSINYIALGSDDMAIGLPAAMATAGLHVPFMGDNPDILNQQYVKNGQEQAGVLFPGHETEAQLVDALARIFTHQSIKPDETAPNTMILDKANDTDPSIYPINYTNYLAEYAKLWGK
jgi:ABC-type sugar transport system substrate-binding protein